MKEEKVEWFYQCQKCGALIRSSAHEKIPVPPSECYEDQGGCGRSGKNIRNITFEILTNKIRQLEKKLEEKEK